MANSRGLGALPTSGVWLQVEGFGESIVARQLLRFSDRLVAPLLALETAATMLRYAVERQFDTEGAYASGGWPELAESTIKKRGDDGHPILEVTSRLKDSLTRKYDPEHIEVASVDSLTFGSRVAYGIFHQSSGPRRRLPFRPPIALTEADKVAMVREMQAVLLGHRDTSHPAFFGSDLLGAGAGG